MNARKRPYLFPREWQLFAGDFGKIASLQNPKQSELRVKKIEGSKYAVDRRGTEGCVALVALLALLDLLVVFFEFG